MRVGFTIFDNGQLIESHAKLPMPDSPSQFRRDRDILRACVNNDKVIAQPVHLYEGQSGVESLLHGGHITSV